MNKKEINDKYKGGFSLFDDYKTIELIPEPKNNRDNLLWLWCYDANMMPLSFANISKAFQEEIVTKLVDKNSLKSVLITVVIDGLIVAKNGHLVRPHEYTEDDE